MSQATPDRVRWRFYLRVAWKGADRGLRIGWRKAYNGPMETAGRR